MSVSPAEILARLPSSFEKARESGDLFFYPSTIRKHKEFGVEVQLPSRI
jgi:ATP adenylyltransferase